MAKASEKVIGVRLTKDQRALVERFQRSMGFTTLSDAVRVLLERGLFITATPKGPWRESAFKAAYQNYLMQIHASVAKHLMEPTKGVNELIEKGIEEAAKRLDFNIAE